MRLILSVLILATALINGAAAAPRRNVILIVADGLRAGIVSPETAPAMATLRDQGVDFTNPHAMVPTFTMPNASALATGHFLGDTGVAGNTMYLPRPLAIPGGAPSRIPFIENNAILRELHRDESFHGDFLNAETVIAMARRSGYATAVLGKLGPVGLQDMGLLDDGGAQLGTILLDDSVGRKNGLAIPEDLQRDITARTGHPPVVPDRHENSFGGNCERPGTTVANDAQQRWFADVATKVLLPRFRDGGKPFFLIYWSRDPDGTQHNQGDSFGKLTPGVNGPTSLKAVRGADDALRQLREALRSLGLEGSTDIVVTADHGFAAASKQSKTSASAVISCAGADNLLPQGFLALDLARALDLPLADPEANFAPVSLSPLQLSRRGHGVLGKDPKNPAVVVLANGGSDLIYLPDENRKQLAPKIAAFLVTQDYVSGLFVDDDLGPIPGTLPLSAIGLKGGAHLTQPAMLVNFTSVAVPCGRAAILCTATVTDAPMVQGQGQHGSLSRAETANFMAALGPSFKTSFKDPAPASNADVGATIAHLLGAAVDPRGRLKGRVLTEAFVGGAAIAFTRHTLISAPAANGLATMLNFQRVGDIVYVDAAGFPGRTVGLESAPPKR